MQDNPNRHDYNLENWMDQVVTYALTQAKHTETNHIMWTLGGDFAYQNADRWFHNLDKLIHYAKINGTVNLLYSTPSRYFEEKKKCSVNNDKGQKPAKDECTTPVTWELRKDDIFPYADGPHHYWTGYFASRPSLKRLVSIMLRL